jgi:DNA polymerase-3 subunit chi
MMAWEQGHRVSVRTQTEPEARALDELMWDSPAGRFLPHGTGQAGENSPVCIADSGEDIPDGRDVIINLASTAVPEPARFRRLLEIVPPQADQRTASREKFRQYRDQGLEPAHHAIGKS